VHLSDVKLEDDVSKRVDAYDYTYSRSGQGYKLCATFKTDTSSRTKKSNPFTSSYTSYSSYGDSPDPYTHSSGEDCFTYTSGYGGYIQPDLLQNSVNGTTRTD
jgi:hypothetical protein